MDDSTTRLGVCAEIGRGLRREADAGQLNVVGRILHSFTDNMPRREIQGVGSVGVRWTATGRVKCCEDLSSPFHGCGRSDHRFSAK
jgi:hypothetical protein